MILQKLNSLQTLFLYNVKKSQNLHILLWRNDEQICADEQIFWIDEQIFCVDDGNLSSNLTSLRASEQLIFNSVVNKG